MIAGEKHLVSVQQHLVTGCVARRRNACQLGIDFQLMLSRDDTLDAESGRAISSMHDARTPEMRREPRVVCNVVAVREEHEAHPAHPFDLPDKWRRKSGRVNEDVAA